MNKRLSSVASAALFFALAAAPAAAQGRGRGQGKPKPQSSSATVTIVFHDSDRGVFRDYFSVHKITPQPLPPGIAKNVARGKPLPPGIAKKALPQDLVVFVGPRVDADVTYYIVGDRVVAVRQGLVIDILLDVFGP